jgi:hypothetical protein
MGKICQMQKNNDKPIYASPAYLWDSINQLRGTLQLWETAVVFQFADFKEGHLSLRIPLTAIEKMEEFLVFDLAKNGLRIQDREGKYDLFVLEEVSQFKIHLNNELANLKPGI